MKSDQYRSINRNGESHNAELQFNYVTPFIEYSFYKSEHWYAEIPVQFGFGKARYVDSTTQEVLDESNVFVYEPAMTIEYRFWRFFGVGAGVGFRLALKDKGKIEDVLTSPEYIFRFKIYFGDIYKELTKD